jgi:hypothetical protein
MFGTPKFVRAQLVVSSYGKHFIYCSRTIEVKLQQLYHFPNK